MWKTSERSLSSLNTISLYTPAAFVHKGKSSIIYKNVIPNTVENITNLSSTLKTLLRIVFIPITNFIYKDLIVNSFCTNVYGLLPYENSSLDTLSNTDSFLYEDTLYQSSTIDPLFVNTSGEDIYIEAVYEIKNITTLRNIDIFIAAPDLYEIYIQSDSYSNPQLITTNFLNEITITPETVIKYKYRYRIYDDTTKQAFSILNNTTNITARPILVFEHTFENYDEIDLVLYRDKSYKRIYGLDSINKIFNSQNEQGFIMNSGYGLLIMSTS